MSQLETIGRLAEDSANVSIAKEDIACLHEAMQWALKNEPLVTHDDRARGVPASLEQSYEHERSKGPKEGLLGQTASHLHPFSLACAGGNS
jgi:hypothetical protein